MRWMFHLLNVLALLLYVFSTAVQYNDPDPLVWMAVYGLAAVACGVAWKRPLHWELPALLVVVALPWGSLLLAGAVGKANAQETFGVFSMGANPAAEEIREGLGLYLVTAWMVVLTVRARRHART